MTVKRRIWGRVGLLALACWLTPAALADEPRPPGFVLITTAGTSREGPLEALGPDWQVKLGGEATPGTDWASLRRVGQPLPAYPASAQVILTNGDRFPMVAKDLALASERLTLRHPRLGEGKSVSLPITSLSLLWLQPLDEGEEPGKLRRRLASARRTSDEVLLRNGDVLEGLLESIRNDELEIEIDRKRVRVALAKVAAVALSSELARPLRPKGAHARLILTDGSRLTLQEAAADARQLTGKTVVGASIKVPLNEVAALEAQHDRIVYLSDLKPTKYEHTPYLSLKWPLAINGSVVGGDLDLVTGTHDRGLSMHSASRVTYTLPAGFERFEALVGLDPTAGRLGSVKLFVELDGKAQPVAEGKEITSASGAVPVRVDLKGAKELKLVVEFGRGGDVGDHVNWVDTRLVK